MSLLGPELKPGMSLRDLRRSCGGRSNLIFPPNPRAAGLNPALRLEGANKFWIPWKDLNGIQNKFTGTRIRARIGRREVARGQKRPRGTKIEETPQSITFHSGYRLNLGSGYL